MALRADERLGPYQILGLLGTGGMGEVYKARDTRLGREVAIKVLPAERLSDEHRRARFVREARAASALNHPNIVTIHEIESAEGVDFIVMELVPGKTLGALIPRPGMRLCDVLRIAIPLTDALAAAHGAGIVHRDLKPANVMVTSEGIVKVLDFGLAKLTRVEQASGEDDTTLDAQARLSRPGAVAGTPAYMSPEQAAAGPVDARSDIFSLGAVLYEMVTGRRPFGGGSTAEALASLLKEQPQPPSEIVAEGTRDLERIILRCLRKDPARRFQNVLDVKVELLEVGEELAAQAVRVGAVTRRPGWRWLSWTAAGIVVLTAFAVAIVLQQPGKREPRPPRLIQLAPVRVALRATFSPDGNQIAYASSDTGGRQGIGLQMVGEAEVRVLTGTSDTFDDGPEWSPDGTQIAFVRSEGGSSRIYAVSPVGGLQRRLSDFPVGQAMLSWSPDGRWLVAEGETPGSAGIHLIPVGGGAPRAVSFPRSAARDTSPAFSPDGHALAYAACGAAPWDPPCEVYVLRLDSEMRPQGQARRLTSLHLWIVGLAWTRDGRSIVWGSGYEGGYLWRVRADGSSPPERVELAGNRAILPSTARGQDRLAFIRHTFDTTIYRLEIGADAKPILDSMSRDLFAQYAPDGRRIAFASRRSGDQSEVWLADADGANPVRLTRGPGHLQGSPRWSPDGRTIAFDSRSAEGQFDIWTVDIDGSGLRQITHDPSFAHMPSFSRDGRWIYFCSTRTGREEVWRVPSSGGSGEQITREGGTVPSESLDGRTLYYRSPTWALRARSTAGGPDRVALGCVSGLTYAVSSRGIVYLACGDQDSPPARQQVVRSWDAHTGQDQVVARFESPTTFGLSLSPDGRSILYDRSNDGYELMMIEDFR